MRKSQVVKSIFWELRAAGVEGSARDILRLAHFLVRSHLGEISKPDDYGRVVESRSLPLLPVDIVMAGGGWRLVDFENSRLGYRDFDAPESFTTKSKTQAKAINGKLSVLGSASRKIDGQSSFVSKLSDTIEAGIGNLVDADLAKESARLQALQVKQQLGVQALSIANQAPQTITSLFR
jgi:hypothetical protein